jgi:hypothetical protein
VLSSQIEGTQASMPQLLLFEVNERVEQDVPDVREVANYIRALEAGKALGRADAQNQPRTPQTPGGGGGALIADCGFRTCPP